MKKIFLFAIIISSFLEAQIPTGYYDGTSGLTGAALKTKLSSIINNGASDTGYNWLTIDACDIDKYYEKDNSILDVYSENPLGTDPYVYQPVTDHGSSGAEGSGYNREHVIPQSFFNQNSPMVSDYHHILATDTQVNGKRSNFPFGNVASPSWTSRNGSKLGSSNSLTYSGTVFEPIDEFKGDIARIIMYFATRYESRLSGFNNNDILSNTSYPGIEPWELEILLQWAKNDKVSQKEIDRNNCVYGRQRNRNPYVDHPEWVIAVFDPANYMATQEVSKVSLKIYPNPVKNNTLYVNGPNADKINRLEIYNMNGVLVQVAEKPFNGKNYLALKNLPKGVYIAKMDEAVSQKFIVE